MENPPRPDGGPNHNGWAVIRVPHRCTSQYCDEPAVVMYWSAVGGYGWHTRPRHWRGKYACDTHLEQWWSGLHYDADAGTIWWENERGREYLAGPIPAAS
jgi:hypothetical protein